MRLDRADDGVVRVVLSHRNLLALLTKLNHPDSAREIQSGDVPEGWHRLEVHSEPDEIHYASETRRGEPAGRMVAWTEADIRREGQQVRRSGLVG